MKLDFDRAEMMELLKSFYNITGLMTAVADIDRKTLIHYPEEPCWFCWLMKSTPETSRLCDESDAAAMRRCLETRKLSIYSCHAGLLEVCTPLTINEQTVGYILFGQVLNKTNADEVRTGLLERADRIEQNDDRNWLRDIPVKSAKEIEAAATIMTACARYLILEKVVQVQVQKEIEVMDSYIMNNLNGDLSVAAICEAIGTSRSKLYDLCKDNLHTGIAEHVLAKRLEKACELLSGTNTSITDISLQCGFNDYNYFCRVFKREIGRPARRYREYNSFAARSSE